jgi:DNA primase
VYEFITKKAVNFIFFKTGLLLKETAGDPIKISGLIKEIVGSISLIPDPILRSVYVKECAALIDISEQSLMNELNKIRRAAHEKKLKEKNQDGESQVVEPLLYQPEKQTDFDMNSSEDQEKKIVGLLMNFGNQEITFDAENDKPGTNSIHINVASFIINDLKNDGILLHNKLYQKIIDNVSQTIEGGTIPNDVFFLYHNDVDIAMLAATLLIQKYELHDWSKVRINVKKEEDNLKLTVIQSLLSFKLRELEKMYDNNQKSLKNAADETEIGHLLNHQQKILKKKKIISAELGRIVLR